MTGSHFILTPGAPRPVSRLVSDPDHPDLLIRTHTPAPAGAPSTPPCLEESAVFAHVRPLVSGGAPVALTEAAS